MRVIDFRMRPPFESFVQSFYYDVPSFESSAAKLGFQISGAIKQASMDLLIQEMDEANVVKAVVPIRKTTGGDNHDIAKLQAEYPDRFLGFAWIDPLQGASALQDIDTFITNGSCTGIVMEPAIDTTPIKWKADAEEIYLVYKLCEERDIPILFTWGGILSDFNDYNPAQLLHICKDFPNLKIVLAHGGFPWVQAICQVALQCPNLYLEPDIYMFSKYPGAADYYTAANYILQDQFVFGSVYPGLSLKAAVDDYLTHLRAEVAEKVMYKNAAKVLGLV